MTSKGLRILCYHGFSLDDEYLFRPKLFMRKDVFAKRLDKISQMGFSVISLDEAVHSLQAGKPLLNSVVITVDDGWQGVEDIAWPLFERFGYAWTLYLASYYSNKQTQVMNLALQYICWKTTKKDIDLSGFGADFQQSCQLHQVSDYENLAYDLTRIGEKLATAKDRQNFVRDIAVLLDVDQNEIEDKKLFYFVDMNIIEKMHQSGVDIQLHTHRHTLGGVEQEKLNMEINENREMIMKVCSHRPVHFCYPSGYYAKEHFQWLRDKDIISATTCHAGFNYTGVSMMELSRFLDGEDVSEIEFEAELSGFTELLRKLR